MPKVKQQSALFIMTIDTEEEWDWNGPFPESDCSVSNVQKIPEFQAFCESLGIRPTYFVDYAAADNDKAANALREAMAKDHCEIGAHLHPWCNPPFFGKTTEAESHVVNLPIQQVEQKLDALIESIVRKFERYPRSFRTGRWGINAPVLKLLNDRGFLVDSSVYPYYENEFFSCKPSPLTAYWPDLNNPLIEGIQRNIMEIPVTAGFTRRSFERWDKIIDRCSQPPLSHFRSVGMLWHSGIVKKLYLSPELTNADDMLSLVHNSLLRGNPIVHMYLHSSSLIDGATGLLKSENALQTIMSRINKVVTTLQQSTLIDFVTATEAYYKIKASSEITCQTA